MRVLPDKPWIYANCYGDIRRYLSVQSSEKEAAAPIIMSKNS
jgi:hypothetical protein